MSLQIVLLLITFSYIANKDVWRTIEPFEAQEERELGRMVED
jgi:hypothetical protein